MADPVVEQKNDCEIVCVSKLHRQYAEMIESRLRNLGLRVDVLFPNPDIPLNKIVDNISSRGILFAIVVTAINEQHRSLTLSVLQGQQQEHRNMPLEDAMGFIAKNFEAAVEGKMPGVISDVLPDDIRTVMGFLADNRPLSVMEYDKLIRYFSMRREGVLRMEYGENIPPRCTIKYLLITHFIFVLFHSYLILCRFSNWFNFCKAELTRDKQL